MAAGGFVSRAFESMLRECSGKKFPDLQRAIQTYLGYILFFFSLCFYFNFYNSLVSFNCV